MVAEVVGLSTQEARPTSKRNRHVAAREEAAEESERHQDWKTKGPEVMRWQKRLEW